MEETAKAVQSTLKSKTNGLQTSLQAAVDHFRIGKDIEGMEDFSGALEELEHWAESDKILQQPQIDLHQLLPALRELHLYMKNQDMTGITDFLEDTFIPLTREILKGCDET